MDFIFPGDWVHDPEPVSHVAARSMDQPDAIKTGWTITSLWFLWSAFVGSSALLSAVFAGAVWRVGAPNQPLETNALHRLQA